MTATAPTNERCRRLFWRIRYLRARLALLTGGEPPPPVDRPIETEADERRARWLALYLEARLAHLSAQAPKALAPAGLEEAPLIARALPLDAPQPALAAAGFGLDLDDLEDPPLVTASRARVAHKARAKRVAPAARSEASVAAYPIERGLEAAAFSAFAPLAARPGARVLVQAVVHTPLQADAVRRAAAERDPKARRRGAAMLRGKLAEGDVVRVSLEAPGLRARAPIQRFVWSGAPLEAFFEVAVPLFKPPQDYVLTLRAEVNGAPLGRLAFTLAVDKAAPRSLEPAALPAYRPYEYVFLSYASEDRDRVLGQAQMLDRLGIPFFQDIVSLRAGQRWAVVLEEEMAKADLLLLFWSKAAAKSHWVRQEAEWALTLQRRSVDGRPEIRPVLLDGPPPPKPPESLAEIHFNDPIRCVQAAYRRT